MTKAQGTDFAQLWQQIAPEDRELLTRDELATSAMVKEEGGRISDAYELLAVYGLLHGNLQDALARLRESTEIDPSSAERWEAYIGTLTRTGDIEAIGAAIDEALRHVDNGTLRSGAAKVHQKRGDLDAAETQLLAAIGHEDEQATFARLMLGIVRTKQGRAEEALEPLRAAANAWVDDHLAEAALALALALTGDEEEAATRIARAKSIAPDDPLVQRAAELLVQ
jgi:tetratricopeptide (TPR) repeat protein